MLYTDYISKPWNSRSKWYINRNWFFLLYYFFSFSFFSFSFDYISKPLILFFFLFLFTSIFVPFSWQYVFVDVSFPKFHYFSFFCNRRLKMCAILMSVILTNYFFGFLFCFLFVFFHLILCEEEDSVSPFFSWSILKDSTKSGLIKGGFVKSSREWGFI